MALSSVTQSVFASAPSEGQRSVQLDKLAAIAQLGDTVIADAHTSDVSLPRLRHQLSNNPLKQVTHTLRDGQIEVADVPVPALTDKVVLIRTNASVISAGTEKTKIDMGKMSLWQKARARPDLVRQVLRKVRTEGLSKTISTVGTRLGAANPLGYSSSGTVLAVGGLVEGLRPGDRVACGGVGYANHAEFAVVPKHLLVKVPPTVSDEEAAFTTLGSIALQGVRLADPKLGETVLVLGLGLLGQMAVQMLRANGCRVLGTDLDPKLVTLAERWGAIGLATSETEAACRELTGGLGVDAVLVCAGTASNEPIELCGRVSREKGRVIVVGAVRMDIPREDFFKKEITVVISRSYGPGRYDSSYEEGGNDYPAGYVRFTEQRNMQTVINLIESGALDVAQLITHRFSVEDAVTAYGLIEGRRTEPYMGIVLTYAAANANKMPATARIDIDTSPIDKDRLGVSMIGAGNYATSTLLPALRADKTVELRGLLTSSGRTAAGVAKQFGFHFCASQLTDVLGTETDAVVISTRHNTHSAFVCDALYSRKHVFVEKPLALNMEELCSIEAAVDFASNSQLMVGFNRRYAPLTSEVLTHFVSVRSPRVVLIRVNAGFIPPDHWIQDAQAGGGRIIGEACHFIDLACCLVGSDPVEVHTMGVQKPATSALLNDNVCISMRFADGSIGTVVYTADGAKTQPKEYISIFGGGRSAVIDDFRSAEFFDGDNHRRTRVTSQDKGQRAMIEAWLVGVRSGKPACSISTIFAVSAATIAAVESLTIGGPVVVDPSAWRIEVAPSV